MTHSPIPLLRSSKVLFVLLAYCIVGCYGIRPTAILIQQDEGSKWVRDSSLHFRYYMEPEVWSKERVDSIKVAMEKNFSEVLQKISQDTIYPSEPIHYFIVSDYKKISRLKNINSKNYIFNSWRNSSYSPGLTDFGDEHYPITMKHWRNWNDSSGLAHEGEEHYLITTLKQMNTNATYSREKGLLGIVMANKLWRICDGPFDDAIGIFINESFEGYDIHQLGAYLYRHNYQLLGLNSNFMALPVRIRSPLLASFMKFSVQKYGINIVRCWCKFDYSWNSWFLATNPCNPCPFDVFRIIGEWEQMLKSKNTAELDTIKYKLQP
jgi:hypothetical protein